MQYIVFTGKLYNIFLALNITFYLIFIKQKIGIKTPMIYSNNQTVLCRLQMPNNKKSGQSVLKQIIKLIDYLQFINITIEFNKIFAHYNVKGNKVVDYMS